METVFAPSTDQTISPYGQIKNPTKKNTRGFISRSTENLAPISNNIKGGGLLFAHPPSLSFSYPPPHSIFNPYQQHQPQQPPLLPLPILNPHNSLPSRSRGLSCPPVTRKTNRTRARDQSVTPKKPKKPTKRDQEPKPQSKTSEAKSMSTGPLIVASTVPQGPEPNTLPKDVSKFLTPAFIQNNNINFFDMKDLESFSGSVFTLSPPPSSLPLPKFSIRPKLSCTAEAAGVDAGATDNLRRLLRLQ